MDITLDGEMWINLHEIGRKSDFAMLANDLYKASGRHRRAWIRGYHRNNRDVSYRETRSLVFVDCEMQTLGQIKSVAYDSEMNVVEELGFESAEPVVPGTYNATYLRALCSA